jgi:hypothetical protein
MNSDFIGSACSSNLPSDINTLDDVIAYLCEARKTVGGDTKFRIVCDYHANDSDEYQCIDDVVLKGSKSLMKKNSRSGDTESYVLLTY